MLRISTRNARILRRYVTEGMRLSELQLPYFTRADLRTLFGARVSRLETEAALFNGRIVMIERFALAGPAPANKLIFFFCSLSLWFKSCELSVGGYMEK
jgi:hypothetical protein